jgi:hypothetical protein
MTNHWIVDRLNSYLIGSLLKGITNPVIPYPILIERKWQIWIEILFISICHSTNWDSLHHKILEIASNDIQELDPVRIAKIDNNGFKKLFASGIDAERINIAERVKLLRNLGENSLNWFSEKDDFWLNQENISLVNTDGLYAWLNKILAFSDDPLQKKSRVLVHQLLRYGLISIIDIEHIYPAIDYHIIRLYIRTERVRPLSINMKEQLKSGKTVRVEVATALRRAVEEAMYYSAAGANLRIDVLNHFEWQISRSFCTRQEARCHCDPIASKPIDNSLIELSYNVNIACPFVLKCPGVHDSFLRKMSDPQSVKSYY